MPQTRRTRKSPVRRRSFSRAESYEMAPRRRSRNVWDNFEQLALIALEDGEEVDDPMSNDANEIDESNEINETNVQRRGKRRNRRRRSRSRSQRRRSSIVSDQEDDEFDDIPEENSSDEEYTPRNTRRNMIHNEMKDEDSADYAVTLHHNPHFKNKQQNSSLDVLNRKTEGGSSKSRKALPSKTKNPKPSSKTMDYSNAKSKAVIKNLESDSNYKSKDSSSNDENKNGDNSDASTKVLVSGSQTFLPTTSHATKSKTPEPKHEELPPPHLDSNLRS